MTNAFTQLMRDAEKPVEVPETFAEYSAALVAGTHEITSLTIKPKRTWVGLDRGERDKVRASVGYTQYMTAGEYAEKVQEATEAKLKEKNT